MSLTLGIIKPDAVQSGKAGSILAHLEASGFTVRGFTDDRDEHGPGGRVLRRPQGAPILRLLGELHDIGLPSSRWCWRPKTRLQSFVR